MTIKRYQMPLSKSINNNKPGKFCFLDLNSTLKISLTFSPQNLPPMKPFCVSFIILSKTNTIDDMQD